MRWHVVGSFVRVPPGGRVTLHKREPHGDKGGFNVLHSNSWHFPPVPRQRLCWSCRPLGLDLISRTDVLNIIFGKGGGAAMGSQEASRLPTSGTARLRNVSMSARTSGSQFSLIVMDALVCCTAHRQQSGRKNTLGAQLRSASRGKQIGIPLRKRVTSQCPCPCHCTPPDRVFEAGGSGDG